MSYAPVPYEQDPGQWINGCINAIVAGSVTAKGNTADTNEDVLQTFTLPANMLNQPGFQASMAAGALSPQNQLGLNAPAATGIRVKAWGVTANNGDTKTLRVYHGTTSFAFTLNTGTAAPWVLEFILLRSGAATQIAMGTVLHGTTLIAPQQTTGGTDTLSSALVCKITGQASVANANDIVCNGAIVELIT